MTAVENYGVLLERYFGPGSLTVDPTTPDKNNLTGALNRAGDFETFKVAFEPRLRRLAGYYPKNSHSRTQLLKSLNDIARARNWKGAYAEAVAFDFLNSEKNWLSEPIQLSTTVPAIEALAGKSNVNFDGWYEDFGVYFDVKIMGTKAGDILERVVAQAVKTLGLTNVTIQPEYPLDFDFAPFEQNRDPLCSELENAIDVKAQTTLIRSKILPCLSYRLLWGAGILTSVSCDDPCQHAETHHRQLFKYAKNFSRVCPSLIVFVVFPWLSEMVLNSPFGQNEHFYRAFSRRFFCQYAKDTSPASEGIKDFSGPETMSQVTEKLSGVLFLEDVCVESKTPKEMNVNGFCYLNPNATKKVSGHFREYLRALDVKIEDFAHDNY